MALLFPAWTCIMGFILGAFVGSFLNMAIYRLPRGKSFFNPSRSFCPNCQHALGAPDLFPIASWLLAGGRCRYCDQRIASRYLWVEVLTGSLFAGIWYKFLTESYDPLRAGFAAIIVACLIAVIYIDWELYIIPDELNAAILIAAIAFQALQHNFGGALAGALTGWGILFGIVLLGRLAFGKDAMGDGDVKMMRGVGAFLGPWLTVGNMAMAVVLGLVGGLTGLAIDALGKSSDKAEADEPVPEATPIPLVFLAGIWYFLCLDVLALFIPPLRKWVHQYFPEEETDEEDDWKPTATTIPFGPYLAAGALVCILFGAPIEAGLKQYFHVGPDVSSTSTP